MSELRRSWVLVGSALALALGTGFATAVLVAQPGCTSNCASNCPASSVYIGSADNANLAIAKISVLPGEPACPPYGVSCEGDMSTTDCTHFTITGQAAGPCDVGITFGDRPTELIHLEFGLPSQGCCQGYPVIGDSVYIIPDSPGGGSIYGADGGSTAAVTVLLDGGTTDAGTTDASDGASAD